MISSGGEIEWGSDRKEGEKNWEEQVSVRFLGDVKLGRAYSIGMGDEESQSRRLGLGANGEEKAALSPRTLGTRELT